MPDKTKKSNPESSENPKKSPPKKEKEAPVAKEHFTVTLEAIAPITLEYTVFAESYPEALEIVLRNLIINLSKNPKIQFAKIKKQKAKVTKRYNNIIGYYKNF